MSSSYGRRRKRQWHRGLEFYKRNDKERYEAMLKERIQQHLSLFVREIWRKDEDELELNDTKLSNSKDWDDIIRRAREFSLELCDDFSDEVKQEIVKYINISYLKPLITYSGKP